MSHLKRWYHGASGVGENNALNALPVEEESRGVVLGAERLDVAVAPLEPSPSTVLLVAVAAE